jgi:hypothetical protein
MRALFPLFLVVACSSPGGQQHPPPQPGCTADNCNAISACKIELPAAPTSMCLTTFGPAPAGFDPNSYCIDACSAQAGGGQVAACIAAHASQCADGGSYAVLQLCSSLDGGMPLSNKCTSDCSSNRQICDYQCTGGSQCYTCRGTGAPHCPTCPPDAGLKECDDCSAQCGLTYLSCLKTCQ